MVHAFVQRALTADEPMPAWETVNMGRLESALAGPRHAAFGTEFYPELTDKAAILLYGMVKNHPWENGNKRMGMMSAFLFLGLNGYWWQSAGEQIYAHVTFVAASEARCHAQVKDYLRCYFREAIMPLEQAEAEGF